MVAHVGRVAQVEGAAGLAGGLPGEGPVVHRLHAGAPGEPGGRKVAAAADRRHGVQLHRQDLRPGKRRPAATAKRPDPAPGSTTRAGADSSAAQATIDSTMAAGV